MLSIYFRQPYVLDDASGLKSAGAIVAGFGVSNTALLDVLSGKVLPRARLQAARQAALRAGQQLQAVIDNQPDVPGYPDKDTLYQFGFGLTY